MKKYKKGKIKLSDNDTSKVSAGELELIRRLGEKSGSQKQKDSELIKTTTITQLVAYGFPFVEHDLIKNMTSDPSQKNDGNE